MATCLHTTCGPSSVGSLRLSLALFYTDPYCLYSVFMSIDCSSSNKQSVLIQSKQPSFSPTDCKTLCDVNSCRIKDPITQRDSCVFPRLLSLARRSLAKSLPRPMPNARRPYPAASCIAKLVTYCHAVGTRYIKGFRSAAGLHTQLWLLLVCTLSFGLQLAHRSPRSPAQGSKS